MSLISAWKEAGLPFQLEYSHDAAENLRFLAKEGLLMLPRVGMGVGGLLLGVHAGPKVRILYSVPIPCAHASGPGFVLSPPETAHAVEIIQTASPLSVVGWYCSKPRGPVQFSDADLKLYETLCPEAWQVMLLIRPSMEEDSLGFLCFRDAAGTVVLGEGRSLSGKGEEVEPDPVISPENFAYPEPITVSEGLVASQPESMMPARATEGLSGGKRVMWIGITLALMAGALLLLLFRR